MTKFREAAGLLTGVSLFWASCPQLFGPDEAVQYYSWKFCFLAFFPLLVK